MKQPFLRICCAFLLLGLITAGSMGLIGAVTSEASIQESQAAPWVRILLSARPGCREIRLYSGEGLLMQTLVPTAEGEVTVSLPAPGSFYAVTSEGCTEFSLNEVSELIFTAGCGWAEGRSLHLTKEPYGTVTLARLISQELISQGSWVHYVLKGGEETLYRTLPIPKDSRTLTCRFDAVPYGSYTLEENGIEKCRVVVDENQQTVAISLP